MTYKDSERTTDHVILSEAEGSRRSRSYFYASLDSSATLGMTYSDSERTTDRTKSLFDEDMVAGDIGENFAAI